ncbi:eukaryotic translation initiation factor 3 subunit E-B-like [Parambassis ranga]|uniref:Eukaryotic translation initiation factor 3 subunit E-B-like n=1 Tax=Parambassis ranga TaxID=210632 RepID=A0A6P7I4P1_9TELE|nr:eukaryotic translation initiation factor 3 subunit E-B-like [Parambassis ranga]
MVDFAMDVYKNLYPDKEIPHSLREKRSTVVAQLKQLQSATEPIVKMFEDPETTRQMQSTRDGRMLFDYLSEKHNKLCRAIYLPEENGHAEGLFLTETHCMTS